MDISQLFSVLEYLCKAFENAYENQKNGSPLYELITLRNMINKVRKDIDIQLMKTMKKFYENSDELDKQIKQRKDKYDDKITADMNKGIDKYGKAITED